VRSMVDIRWVLASISAVLVMVALPTAVLAHGGSQVFTGDHGQFRIRSFATLADGRLDYSIDIRELGTGERVTDAEVTVLAVTPNGPQGPWDALFVGTVYEVITPAPEEVDWTVQVNITTGPGTVTFKHHLRLTQSAWLWPTIGVVGAFGTVVVVHAYTGRRRRRRT